MRLQEKILVVDDDSNICSMIESILIQENFPCICFGSPSEALTYLTTERPPIFMAVLDIIMPDMDGIALFDQIKQMEEYSGISVLFISGIAHEQQIINALEMGAIDYIVKPIRLNIFLSKIKTIAKRHIESRRLANTVFSGNFGETSLEEILAFCGNETLNGFVEIHHNDGRTGYVTFVRGLPEHIELHGANERLIAREADAFEKISAWPDAQFTIRRGESDFLGKINFPHGETLPAVKGTDEKTESSTSDESAILNPFYEHLASVFFQSGSVEEFIIASESGKVEYVHSPLKKKDVVSAPHCQFIFSLIEKLPVDHLFTTVRTSRLFYYILNRLDISLVVGSSKQLGRADIDEILANI